MAHASNEAFVAEVAGGAEFGDARLQARLETVLLAAASSPSSSFPSMSSSDAELEGTYRFLNNKRVSADRILQPHFAATAKRVAQCEIVVVTHDTTQLAFGPVPRGDLGPVGRGTTYGFNAHVSFAVSGDGDPIPLGVLAVSLYNRKFGSKRRSPAKNKKDPDSEMLRWNKHVQRIHEDLGAAKNIIHVMDREADDYVLLANLVGAEERFVIRQSVDRRLMAEVAEPKVRSVVASTAVLCERTVTLSARRKPTKKKHATRHPLREERTAVLEVRAAKVIIPRTASAAQCAVPLSLELNVVEAVEKNAPSGETPISWWLWTTEPIDSTESVLAVIDFYRRRWMVEELFKALKSGCRFEDRQLESMHALQNALAIFLPIAWRLLLLRHVSRDAPGAGAQLALTKLQVQALRGFMRAKRKVELPSKLTARDALLAIAAMGGHIKNNGDPGWMVLGRGFDRLLDVEVGLSIALEL